MTNPAINTATLDLLSSKINEAQNAASYFKTATVFIDSTPIPADAPEAYRIAETAFRQTIIESALFNQKQADILLKAFDEVLLLDVQEKTE